MPRAAIDIGTNSMRMLLVDDDGVEMGRWQRVTGLGRGVDHAGRISEEAIERTLLALEEYGRIADAYQARRRAVATSAARDAANRDDFLGRAEAALGVRPEVITGVEEASLAFAGATADGEGTEIVVDIGGGSTELVFRDGQITARSVDIGSVRLTDRLLGDRPAPFQDLELATAHVDALLGDVAVPRNRNVLGVAGTWTSLAAIHAGSDASVHGTVVDRIGIDRLVARLASLTVNETAALPGLDPARAPVILAGAVIARGVMRRLDGADVIVSEHDLLDGVVAGL